MESTEQMHEGEQPPAVEGVLVQGTRRAAIYARVSGPEQAADDKVGLEEQQRDCEAYCQRKGYTVTGVYIDVQSGTDSRKERARFEAMLKEALKERIDVIVAWRPDRLFAASGQRPA